MARWCQAKNSSHSPTIHVDHLQTDPKHPVHRGEGRQKPQEDNASDKKHSVHIKHIPTMITTILLLSYFTVGGTCIKQLRGAPLGSPCSPALCNMVVAEEHCWHHTYGQLIFIHKHFPMHSHTQYSLYFATRYVDKRVLLLPTRCS